MRPAITPEYVEAKQHEAARAVVLRDTQNKTYRQIAKLLGYNHPQSIKELIKNYGPGTLDEEEL